MASSSTVDKQDLIKRFIASIFIGNVSGTGRGDVKQLNIQKTADSSKNPARSDSLLTIAKGLLDDLKTTQGNQECTTDQICTEEPKFRSGQDEVQDIKAPDQCGISNEKWYGSEEITKAVLIGLFYLEQDFVMEHEQIDDMISRYFVSPKAIHQSANEYLATFTICLFTSYAIRDIRPQSWAAKLLSILPILQHRVRQKVKNMEEQKKIWENCTQKWKKYLTNRKTLEREHASKSKQNNLNKSDILLTSLGLHDGMIYGPDITIYAYDALLVSGNSQKTLVPLCTDNRMKTIAGAWFGALYGTSAFGKSCEESENAQKWRLVADKWYELLNGEPFTELNTIHKSDAEEYISMTEDRFVASMVLSGVGNAMGFRNGRWEVCDNGEQIKKELDQLGGVRKLNICSPAWKVNNDTVMHLATAEGIIEACQTDVNPKKVELYKTIATKYKKCMDDIVDRPPGEMCMRYIGALEPEKKGGIHTEFNSRGGGCGAAMRAMCIGLRYPRPTQLQDLIEVSIESGRLSHHHPTGYLGALAAALFTSYALQDKPLKEWGNGLLSTMESAKKHIEREGRFFSSNNAAWPYFEKTWAEYLQTRKLVDVNEGPVFPAKFGIADRDAFYKSVSFEGRAGTSGHDAPLIAYDALLGAQGDWEQVCERGMLHGGDSDSTGVMAGAWYGAMHGLDGVPACNYQNLEYKERLEGAGRALYAIHVREMSGRT